MSIIRIITGFLGIIVGLNLNIISIAYRITDSILFFISIFFIIVGIVLIIIGLTKKNREKDIDVKNSDKLNKTLNVVKMRFAKDWIYG